MTKRKQPRPPTRAPHGSPQFNEEAGDGCDAKGKARVRSHRGQRLVAEGDRPGHAVNGEEAIQRAEAALDALDAWILAGCPGGPWKALEPLAVLRGYLSVPFPPTPGPGVFAEAVNAGGGASKAEAA